MKYTLDIVDVVVGACANALKVNLYIFQRENDNCSLIPTYCCIPSNRDIFLKYHRAGQSHHGLDHYSAIADCPVTDTITNTPQINSNEAKENQKVTTNSTNLKTKKNCMPNQKSDETETESNNGGGFNDQILSDLRDIYGEIGEEVSGSEFYDEYGDEIGEKELGEVPTYPHVIGKPDLPGNNYIDLTDSDSSKLTNSNSNRKVSVTNTAEESDVDIISDPENIDEGVDIPEEYFREARPKKRKHLKTYINFAVFALMDSVHIEEIPWDVDGNQKYTIACEEGEYIDKYKDGRWFEMHTSSRKGLDGHLKMGVCIGSLMCENNTCPKLLTEGVCNTNEFSRDSGAHVCKSCGYFAARAHCGVKKLIEYDRSMKLMTIIYKGKHNCTPKPNLKKKENFLRNIIQKDKSARTPEKARRIIIKDLFAKGKLKQAVEMTREMDDTALLEKMRYASKDIKLTTGPEDEIEAFRNLAKIKEEADTIDTNLIYALNCGAINAGPTYVFKMSRYALDTAVKMDINRKPVKGKISLLSREKAFFNGMHSRCRGYKTLTLWTHHPGMRHMNRLATMECKREDTEMVSIFFRLFNEALAKHVGNENYKFNPLMICTDEAGAILQAIHNVFGKEYLNRIVSCQWHFKQCAHRQLPSIRADDQASFMFYVNRICTASTVAEYKLYASGLEEICRRKKCVKWYNWWKARCFHLVPALRGFGWMGTNWAEIGHSTMKKNRKVWLSVAAAEDIADMIVQENIYLSFIKNEGKTIGKGPTAFTKKMNERKAERYYVNSVVESLRKTDMMDEVEKHKDPDAMFVPSRKAKHRIPKIFSTKNPLQREKMPVRTANAKMRNVNHKWRIEKYSSEEEEEEDNDADVEDLSSSDLGDHQQQATIRNGQINTVDDDFNDDGSDDGETQMPPPTQVVKKKVLPDRKNRGKNRKYKYKYHTPTPEEEGNTSDEDRKK